MTWTPTGPGGPPWRAHGAARVGAGFGADPALPAELPTAMQIKLLRAEVSVEDAHVAWELARLEHGLSAEEHLTLVMLLLLSQDALSRGSTRIDVGDPGQLATRARALLGPDPGEPSSDDDHGPLREGLGERLRALLDRMSLDRMSALLGGPEARRPLVLDGQFLYHQRVYDVEARLARRISERLAPPGEEGEREPAEVSEAIDALRARPAETPTGPIELTSEQEAAVRLALTSRLSLVSGGPGTGKTSIVVAILRAAMTAEAAGDEPMDAAMIALSAPTGKAADRMRRSIEAGLRAVRAPSPSDARLLESLPVPRTLHRLLGYSPRHGGFRHHAGNPLAERLVVVDESSMIDVFLMEHLLASLHPRARLVLLGDAEQLPSVAAGAVFRDLGRADRIPRVSLTESHRMDPSRPEGLNILRVAQQINRGLVPSIVAPVARGDGLLPGAPDAIGRLDDVGEDPARLLGVFLHEPVGEGAREAFLDHWYERRVRGPETMRRAVTRTYERVDGRLPEIDRLEPLFVFAERARLLCITRSAARPTGVEAINLSLHRRLASDVDAPVSVDHLLAGEPLLVSRNDYERGLFNGDQGLVLWTAAGDESPRLAAVFRRDDGFVAHPLAAVRGSLDLGYATTVHKAQGAEHDSVALLLPDTDSPRLLTREIVYTAITRARRSVLVVGSASLLARAAQRRVERSTGVAERLDSP